MTGTQDRGSGEPQGSAGQPGAPTWKEVYARWQARGPVPERPLGWYFMECQRWHDAEGAEHAVDTGEDYCEECAQAVAARMQACGVKEAHPAGVWHRCRGPTTARTTARRAATAAGGRWRTR